MAQPDKHAATSTAEATKQDEHTLAVTCHSGTSVRAVNITGYDQHSGDRHAPSIECHNQQPSSSSAAGGTKKWCHGPSGTVRSKSSQQHIAGGATAVSEYPRYHGGSWEGRCYGHNSLDGTPDYQCLCPQHSAGSSGVPPAEPRSDKQGGSNQGVHRPVHG